MNIERLELFYRSGDVKRLHTVATVNEHTIASHVYGSQLLAAELCAAAGLGFGTLGPVLFTLLYHDAPEVATGDVPAPVKRANPGLNMILESLETEFYTNHEVEMPALSYLGLGIVKASDTLDLCFNCLRERRLGNRTAAIETVFNNAMGYLDSLIDAEVAGVQVLKAYLAKEWADV